MMVGRVPDPGGRKRLGAAARKADELRAENAARMRAELAARGVDPFDIDLAVRFGEGSAVAAIAEWLRIADALEKLRAAAPPDIARLVEFAEELGRLQERLRLHGLEPTTRVPRGAAGRGVVVFTVDDAARRVLVIGYAGVRLDRPGDATALRGRSRR